MDANYYKGPQSFYFKSVISSVIKIGNLDKNNKIILDFGCGTRALSKELPQRKIIMRDRCQPESTITFKEYLYYRIDKARIIAGKRVMEKHKKVVKIPVDSGF